MSYVNRVYVTTNSKWHQEEYWGIKPQYTNNLLYGVYNKRMNNRDEVIYCINLKEILIEISKESYLFAGNSMVEVIWGRNHYSSTLESFLLYILMF